MVIPEAEVIEEKGKTVVLLKVPEYPVKPVSMRGRCYKRKGNSNHLLSGNYTSKSRNKLIARAFKEIGLIERYGSGIHRIQKICKEYGVVSPVFEEIADGFRVVMFNKRLEDTEQVTALIRVLNKEMDRQDIQKKLGLSHRENFRSNYLKPALELGLVEMTVPDKPNSRNQKYRLSDLGRNYKKNENS